LSPLAKLGARGYTVVMAKLKTENPVVRSVLKEHFGEAELHELVTATREYPATARLDLQNALSEVLSGPLQPRKVMGTHGTHEFETITFSHLLVEGNAAVLVAPLQYDEIDAGEVVPARCLRNALWLGAENGTSFALFLSRVLKYGRSTGLHLEIAVPAGEVGSELTRRIFDQIERKVTQAGSYRGKVLSLETPDNYRGGVNGIKVHRLKSVKREEVILPPKTLGLLERNVTRFVEQRDKLRQMQMGIRKGLLFYGPPGTGKTHTISYLASQLKEHTTLLITAEQVALLDEYMQLARFLQPAMVVVEDVDLIARARTSMHNPCEESMLNRLLNEMDGLREDAMVLFILTTNNPEQLEKALTSRPGRIDQAIEFPLPDEEGRRKLIRLYSGGLRLADDLVSLLVQKTKGGSGAFIKELMRRSAQYLVESGGENLGERHIESALDEMLFSGGSLNAKLLGFTKDEAEV
jgi:ATPase family associated with various cellular activities (AAA)